MVSVAREANRKHFPWVKLNIFFLKRWAKLIVTMRGEIEECGGVDMKQRSRTKIERQRKKGDRQRERENKNV